ncbi:MAG TPA: pimeloyl-CoA dehydrogenase large subunit [Spongiibacteraceae bacterium]|nr:pimeloyl-CoA dehydrogenase large subunit [Spongiibacteraceae bacterium]HCS26204.1 pimeloyl-CoA dehydrogenase large subunit [Spongiibacteraceae bacterium]|tara:strand:- start:4452 stop:5648 length:1197 start_codon:yes stop_codon:yes gene_type:complete
MDLNFSPEEERFRLDVRAFLEKELPADIRDKVQSGKHLSKEDYLRWHKILYKKGWVAGNWPKEYGGTDWSPAFQYIFDEERAAAGAPIILPFSMKMVAPVLMAFGDKTQQDYFLPRILSGEDWWCQGYSEPGSGSDLASVSTRAVRDGENYTVNGQKTWTTLAQHADWIFALVRTDPDVKPQKGISFLLIDMKSPGVTVRPIIMLDGGHEVNEVFFDNVKVPVANRVGEENAGWTYAKYLLGHERTNIAEVGGCKQALRQVKELAANARDGDSNLLANPRFADKIAQAEIDLMALEITNLRVMAMAEKNAAPGPEASLLKIKGSELQQTLSELMMETAGCYGLPYQPDALHADFTGSVAGPDNYLPVSGHYFNTRKVSIYGGSNEIQKNIVSRMILGL